MFLLPPGCIQHGDHRGITCTGLKFIFPEKTEPLMHLSSPPEEKSEECLTSPTDTKR